jgi:ParB family chromosome partitioning protein
MSRRQKAGLGRGLDNLLGGDEPAVQTTSAGAAPGRKSDDPIRELPLNQLQAGRYQPRTRMDEAELLELADSITEHGIIQPILVRPIGADRYEIIAGERRFRAAALAQLRVVPVIIREVGDEQALAIALIENIQRENLNPLEEAQAIRRLLDEFGYTHERAAQAIGRSRSATTNLLRLLNLAEPVQTMLLAGDVEMGHARCLLPLDKAEQILLAHQIVQRRLSVRESEKLVAAAQRAAEHAASAVVAQARSGQSGYDDRDVTRLRDRLADHLGTRVEIVGKAGGKGRLVIHFSNSESFNGLLDRMHLNAVLEDGDDR